LDFSETSAIVPSNTETFVSLLFDFFIFTLSFLGLLVLAPYILAVSLKKD